MNKILHELFEALGDEKEALLSGELSKLDTILKTKKDALTRLHRYETVPPTQYVKLRDMSHENQQLYSAALAGLRSAAQRILSVRHARNGFSVYTRDGLSRKLHERDQTRSKRA